MIRPSTFALAALALSTSSALALLDPGRAGDVPEPAPAPPTVTVQPHDCPSYFDVAKIMRTAGLEPTIIMRADEGDYVLWAAEGHGWAITRTTSDGGTCDMAAGRLILLPVPTPAAPPPPAE
jgi:hypothetical protein